MGKLQLKILILASLVLASFGVWNVYGFYKERNARVSTPSFPQIQAKSQIAATETKNKTKITIIPAPNGEVNMNIREETNGALVTEAFTIINQKTGKETQIYKETLAQGNSITVPYNTFSPDNKYVFLQKTEANATSYFVLRTDGTPMEKDGQILDFLNLFNEKYPDFKVTDVTGWGGMGLIVMNTNKQNGEKGPSFWYDVSGKTFIQLSTRFD